MNKSIYFVLLILLVPVVFAEDDNVGMGNPSAIYCNDLGYEYKNVETSNGDYGICIMPDKTRCDSWEFLEGTCGGKYRYCETKGYRTVTKTDGNNPYSKSYAVCYGASRNEIGPVIELMGMYSPPTNMVARIVSNGGQSSRSIPDYMDWRSHNGHNWMTPVRNQYSCGGCWAFAALGIVEAEMNIDSGNWNLDLNLAEEYLISDCDDTGSCCGGSAGNALRFIRDNGVVDESCMNYDSSDCSCDAVTDTCSVSSCDYNTGNSCSDSTCTDRCNDWYNRLTYVDYTGRIGNGIDGAKRAIFKRGPVATSMYMDGSLDLDGIYRCGAHGPTGHAIVSLFENKEPGERIVIITIAFYSVTKI